MAKEGKTKERYEVRLVKIEGGRESVMETRDVPHDKLREAAISQLPERDAMSLVNANLAAPINLAAALNVLSDNSIAYADATQTGQITQGI